MNTLLAKIFDIKNVYQLTDKQDLWWNESKGPGWVSWIIIGVLALIIVSSLVIWLIKTIIKAGIKGVVVVTKFAWKYLIWWWLKWLLVIIIILFIIILIVQGFGIWLGDYSSFWWVFQWMTTW